MKYVVISQPKAGTYLAANLIESLGIEFSHIHIDPGMYRIFKNNKLNDFDIHKAPLSRAINALPNNQFAVGHIPLNEGNKNALSKVKKVLIVRDRNGIRKSAERYRDERGVDVSSIINNNNLDQIESWKNEQNVFLIKFEDIINENVEVVNELQKFLFGNVIRDSSAMISNAKNKESLTKSSIR